MNKKIDTFYWLVGLAAILTSIGSLLMGNPFTESVLLFLVGTSMWINNRLMRIEEMVENQVKERAK